MPGPQADLSLAAVDLIRVRLPRAQDDHSLALDAGVDLLAGSRKLLLAAACSTVRPQRQWIPVAPSLAKPDQTHLFAPPFERRANRTLVAGLRAVREEHDERRAAVTFDGACRSKVTSAGRATAGTCRTRAISR